MSKYGPPPHRLRPYPSQLEGLERRANSVLLDEYASDVLKTMAVLEAQLAVNPAMIDLQPEIQWFMRPFLLDFLIELHSLFKLQPHTLFLCLNIIDRYCAKRIVFKRHYQLVGCTALWIAGKYEDKKLRVPTLKELTVMCRQAYDEEMFVQMEMHILSTLEWLLSHPNLEECLQLAIADAGVGNDPLTTPKKNTTTTAVTAVARFLCELSLYHRYFLLVPTSMVAVTAHLLASSMLQLPNATDALVDIVRRHHLHQSRTRSLAQTLYLNNNTSNYSHSHFDEMDILMDEDATDDDEYSDDDFVDAAGVTDENTPPEVLGAFLSGFDMSQIATIREIALQFVINLNNITEVLTKKYEPLGVIQVLQNFHHRFQYIISSVVEQPPVDRLLEQMANYADIILQLPNLASPRVESSPLQLYPLQPTPATPPLATSQYLVFSNKRSSTVLTPVYSSTSSINRTRSKISKHKQGHASSSTFTEYSPTTHKFKFAPLMLEWSLPISHYN